jgi:hypothetical protein
MQGGGGHAWLVVQTSQGDLALDNNYKTVMPNSGMNYTNRIRQTGITWARSGILYADIPIAYMDGVNSTAFMVGDRVVVELTGQSWAAKKVIGFEANPRPGYLLYCKSLEGSTYVTKRFTIAGGYKDSVAIWQTSSSVMSYNSVTKKIIVVARAPFSGAKLLIDSYAVPSLANDYTVTVNLWTGYVKTYLESHGYTESDIASITLGNVFFNAAGTIHATLVIVAGSVIIRYLAGYVAITVTHSGSPAVYFGTMAGDYFHNYGAGFVPSVIQGACILGGIIYLADNTDGLTASSCLRRINENTGILIDITVLSAIPDSAYAVHATAARIYMVFLTGTPPSSWSVNLAVYDTATMVLLRTTTLQTGSSYIRASIFPLFGKIVIVLHAWFPEDLTTMYTLTTEGILESSVSLGALNLDYFIAA